MTRAYSINIRDIIHTYKSIHSKELNKHIKQTWIISKQRYRFLSVKPVFQTSISKSMTRVDNFSVQPLRMVGAVFSQQLLRQQSLPIRSTWARPSFFTCFSGDRDVHAFKLYVITFLVPYCDVRYDFHVKKMFDSSFYFVRDSCFIYVICIYLRILVPNTISISDDVGVVW